MGDNEDNAAGDLDKTAENPVPVPAAENDPAEGDTPPPPDADNNEDKQPDGDGADPVVVEKENEVVVEEAGGAEEAPAEEEKDPNAVFKPKTYIFELYNYNKLKAMLFTNTLPDNLEIRCPEFAILLDHTIAVLWLFYNDPKNWKNFSVPQIEWALKFIGGIASDQGDTFTDMETMKKHLEQLLFQTYSEIDPNVLQETPPIDDFGQFGPVNCPIRTKFCTPIPESIKELLFRAPEMVVNLSLALEDQECGAQDDDLEITRANMMQSAYVKLNSFEKKHLSRITEEIELFEMIKGLKEELGYHNEDVNPMEITTLRVKMEELEQKLLDKADQH